ncbi:MAG: DUF2878 domain-containing protein [Betaproteobacteria bacterium]|nr:DUF2878 domain-containing protein [Betaproteobacteria bacterium]
MTVICNLLLFQAGWFACVIGAAQGQPWAGSLIALAIVGGHLARAACPRRELALVLLAALIGALWDSALAATGWIAFVSGQWVAGTAPHWMIALWMIFATTLNVSLAWLKDRLPVAALAGSIGGPLAYFGGAKLGALEFVAPVPALIALAVAWGLLTPLLLVLARRFDGYGLRRMPAIHGEADHA